MKLGRRWSAAGNFARSLSMQRWSWSPESVATMQTPGTRSADHPKMAGADRERTAALQALHSDPPEPLRGTVSMGGIVPLAVEPKIPERRDRARGTRNDPKRPEKLGPEPGS